ncbi:MAG: orotidine-5'-phosphate decarboxylase [Planctomycetota bacterium]|nr:orotidine-5'-phosphate decarboxylase [Planctomycetota bacterium]
MTHFADRLCAAVRERRSVVCVGIDPVVENLPPALAAEARKSIGNLGDILVQFGIGIIDAVADIVPAVKANIGFFEAYGLSGLSAYIGICTYARSRGLLVIGDVKRGDIGSTASAYAKGLLAHEESLDNPYRAGQLKLGPHDAITLNPYLGSDALAPFLAEAHKNGQGLFILVKTSNPASAEIQDLLLQDGSTVAAAVARMVDRLGNAAIGASGLSAVGAVVGATQRREMERLRQLMPRAPFLLPGYGAQGGTADDTVAAFRPDATGALVNASRSVIFAWQAENRPDDWQAAARRAAERMNADLRRALQAADKWPW